MAIELPLSPQWRLATSFHDLAMGLLRTWFGNGQNALLAYRVVVRRVPHHSCISRRHCVGERPQSFPGGLPSQGSKASTRIQRSPYQV